MPSHHTIALVEREPGVADPRRALLAAELRASRLEQRLDDCEEALRAVTALEAADRVELALQAVRHGRERVMSRAAHQRRLEAEREARQRAEAVARSRDEFLAVVAHELRSPLNGIQTWAEVLRAVAVDPVPAVGRALAGIRLGIAQQVRLIDELLDADRIISGGLRLSLAPVPLATVIRAAADSLRLGAADRGIELRIDHGLAAAIIEGDRDRLQQIVWNLLSNAIKFTPRGGHVWLSGGCDDGWAVLVIRDDGRGIEPSFQPRLFERFQREACGEAAGQDGFGLGLMVVRQLCRLHGGDVHCASAGRDRGACFTVRLPLDRGDSASQDPPHRLHADARCHGHVGCG